EEVAASRPHVTRRVVSLVPSVTETLLAWGITPVACTRFCEQPELVHVGGTKDPDIAAIVALAPAGVGVHALAIRHVDDVAPALTALASVLAVDLAHTGRVGAETTAPTRRRCWTPLVSPMCSR